MPADKSTTATSTETPPRFHSEGRQISVLIIEDSEADRYLMRRQMKKLGESLVFSEYDNCLDVLAFIKATCETQNSTNALPDIILLDINMPLMSGFEFLDTLATLRQQYAIISMISVYIVSTSESEQDRQRSSEYGFVSDYIVKPVSPERLSDILSSVTLRKQREE